MKLVKGRIVLFAKRTALRNKPGIIVFALKIPLKSKIQTNYIEKFVKKITNNIVFIFLAQSFVLSYAFFLESKIRSTLTFHLIFDMESTIPKRYACIARYMVFEHAQKS